MSISTFLLILAFVFFVLVAIGKPASTTINFTGVGLALATLAFLLGGVGRLPLHG